MGVNRFHIPDWLNSDATSEWSAYLVTYFSMLNTISYLHNLRMATMHPIYSTSALLL